MLRVSPKLGLVQVLVLDLWDLEEVLDPRVDLFLDLAEVLDPKVALCLDLAPEHHVLDLERQVVDLGMLNIQYKQIVILKIGCWYCLTEVGENEEIVTYLIAGLNMVRRHKRLQGMNVWKMNKNQRGKIFVTQRYVILFDNTTWQWIPMETVLGSGVLKMFKNVLLRG